MFARTSLVAALAFAGAKLALAQDDVSSSQCASLRARVGLSDSVTAGY